MMDGSELEADDSSITTSGGWQNSNRHRHRHRHRHRNRRITSSHSKSESEGSSTRSNSSVYITEGPTSSVRTNINQTHAYDSIATYGPVSIPDRQRNATKYHWTLSESSLDSNSSEYITRKDIYRALAYSNPRDLPTDPYGIPGGSPALEVVSPNCKKPSFFVTNERQQLEQMATIPEEEMVDQGILRRENLEIEDRIGSEELPSRRRTGAISFGTSDDFHAWLEACGSMPFWKNTLPSIEETSTGYDESDAKSSIESLFSTPSVESVDVPSLVSDTTLSSKQSNPQKTRAVEELVAILIKDSQMKRLIDEALKKIGPERFERNFTRLLKRYSKDLQDGASNSAEKKATTFVRSHARQAAKFFIRQFEFERGVEGRSNLFDALIQQESERSDILERFLDGQDPLLEDSLIDPNCGFIELLRGKEDMRSPGYESEPDESGSDVTETEELHKKDIDGLENSYPNLERVREFMVESPAFFKLRQSFHNFLYPSLTEEALTTPLNKAESCKQNGADNLKYLHSTENRVTADHKYGISIMQLAFRRFWTRLRKSLRPCVRPGLRRLEWTCDCGQEIYGDFDSSEPEAVDELFAVLQNTGGGSTFCSILLANSSSPTRSSGVVQSNSPKDHLTRSTPLVINNQNAPPTPSNSISIPPTEVPDLKYLALCINMGEFKKSLAEIEISNMASDGQLFELMKAKYREARGFRARFSFLIKPVSIRFVHFNLFNLRRGYVGFCEMDKPWSIPPSDAREYKYDPVPLKPLPPMPAEVFLHYLEHGDVDDVHKTSHWLRRLPTRLNSRIVDAPEIPVWGWGIHVIEGPNRPVIFWITIMAIFASILAVVLWSSLRADMQGGTALASLIVAMPTVVMAAFLFKVTTE